MKLISSGGAHETAATNITYKLRRSIGLELTASDIITAIVFAAVVLLTCNALFPLVDGKTAPAATDEVAIVDTAVYDLPPAPPKYTEADVEMLAMGIHAASCGKPVGDYTLLLIGNVIVNRVADERFPDSMEAVLTQGRQFSCFDTSGVMWVGDAQRNTDTQQRCRDAAVHILEGERYLSDAAVYVSPTQQGSMECMLDGLYFGK